MFKSIEQVALNAIASPVPVIYIELDRPVVAMFRKGLIHIFPSSS